MTDLEINFAEGDDDVIARGDYTVEVDEVYLKDSQRSEHQYFNFALRITEKANGEEAGVDEGRMCYFVASLSPNTERRTRKLFETFGVNTRPLKVRVDEETGRLEEPDLEGATGVVRIVHGMYEGEKQARVRRFVGRPMEKTETEPEVVDEESTDSEVVEAPKARKLA